MGGVDVSDQRITYYDPILHCCHNWVPIFLQILSIMRNITYVVHKDHYGKNTLSHKRFTMEWVKLCMQRAHLAFYENIDSEASFFTTALYATNTDNRLCKHCQQILDFDDLFSSFSQKKKDPESCTEECQQRRIVVELASTVLLCLIKRKRLASVVFDRKQFANLPCYLCSEHFDAFHNHM
eukprot:14520670-Ditylum_brightwellii.AAC.1